MHKTLEVVIDDKHLGIPIGHDSNKLLIQSLCNEIMTKTNMLYAFLDISQLTYCIIFLKHIVLLCMGLSYSISIPVTLKRYL
jgi:hypothetical protein